MRIIVMSDSHGLTSAVCSIIERNIGYADMFIHLGDGERDIETARSLYPDVDIRYVGGNTDMGMHKAFDIIDAAGSRIFCSHGHRYGVNGGTETIRSVARDHGCNIVLFGHTHMRFDERIDGMYIMNPGSCSCPRDGKRPSFGSLEITENGIVTGIFDLK